MNSKRIVIDANVYLSALLFGGNPRQVVEVAFLEGHTVIMSEEIFTEMRKVINKKFPKFLNTYEVFESFLRQNAILIKLGEVVVTICRDSKDNMILETAVVGDCEYIITGDNDLLTLGSFKNIAVTTPAEVIKSKLLE